MSRALTALGFRRFLFWIGYDGSFFGEMARGNTGRSMVEFFHLCLAETLSIDSTTIKVTTSSRTDRFVHAIRMSIVAQLPPESHWIDESSIKKSRLLRDFNALTSKLSRDALTLHDFHGISPFFDAREHVIYRKYVYRLCVPRHRNVVERLRDHGPTLASYTETPYAWVVWPQFDYHIAEKVCTELEGKPLNFASFFKHPDGLRRRGVSYRNTDRQLYSMRIEPGEPYILANDEFDYFNIVIVSKGFLREQIRRIIRVLVQIASKQNSMRLLHDIIESCDPRVFCDMRLTAAPPNGLFLADVVYDPRMFERPVPEIPQAWDIPLDEYRKIIGHINADGDEE